MGPLSTEVFFASPWFFFIKLQQLDHRVFDFAVLQSILFSRYPVCYAKACSSVVVTQVTLCVPDYGRACVQY